MVQFATLRTDRLLIRSMELTDAETMYAYRSLPDVTRYQTWRPSSVDEVGKFIEDLRQVKIKTPGQWMQLAICFKATGEMIGDIGMRFAADGSAQVEIGYTISPAYQRKGYATETVAALLGYLINKLGMHRVTASVDPRNAPSVALLEHLGFRREAYFKQSYYSNGEWQDDCIYAILSREWNRFDR